VSVVTLAIRETGNWVAAGSKARAQTNGNSVNSGYWQYYITKCNKFFEGLVLQKMKITVEIFHTIQDCNATSNEYCQHSDVFIPQYLYLH
jgi:hypothetical protein